MRPINNPPANHGRHIAARLVKAKSMVVPKKVLDHLGAKEDDLLLFSDTGKPGQTLISVLKDGSLEDN